MTSLSASFKPQRASCHRKSADNLSAAPLLLNEVRQAVSFRVDEEGAEAAASTVVGGIAAGGMIEADARPIDFHVQRPFCCVLSEQGTGCILFIGKVEGF